MLMAGAGGSVVGAVAMHYTEKLLFPKAAAVAARVSAFFKR